MKTQPQDSTWPEASENVAISQLAHQSGFSVNELAALVEQGVLRPLQKTPEGLVFSPVCVSCLRKVLALRTTHDLDFGMVGLLIGYEHRIEELEHEVRSLKAHMPPHAIPPQREGPLPWREQHAKANAGAR